MKERSGPIPDLRPRCSPLIDRRFRVPKPVRAYPRATELRARTAAAFATGTDAGTGHSFNYVSDTRHINLAVPALTRWISTTAAEVGAGRPHGTWLYTHICDLTGRLADRGIRI